MDNENKPQSSIADTADNTAATETVPIQQIGRKKSRIEDIVYGEPVYWMTVIGSFVVVIGSIVAFITDNTFIKTSHWISQVWDGVEKDLIWENAGEHVPSGHWYLSHLTTGDGLQIVGLAIALFALNVGLIASGITMLRKKETVFATFALVSAAIVTVAIFVNFEH